ncbi:MAG TPA: SHOCT domain-containing protein [Solirubrobacteraceae bacterium]|nr:SHOCT domain-containing protein [Solirubrobacteraceae bacterium]
MTLQLTGPTMGGATVEQVIGVVVEPVEHDGVKDEAQNQTDADQPVQTVTDQPASDEPGQAVAAEPSAHTSSRSRLIWVRILIGITTLLLIVAMFAVWANRLLFNPDNWSNASTQLLQNPDIRSNTANYLVDQLYANVNVAGLIKSGLPTQFQGLAGPAAGALRNAAVQGTELALTRPRVQALWAQANRAADQTFIAIVNGGKGNVKINQGAVSLNLGAILDNVASRLGLPVTVSDKLPANVANLTVFKSDQLKTVQDGGQAVKGLALWLTILCPLLYALAVFLAPGHRRRTLMTIGFAALFAGLIVLFTRRVLENQIPLSLTDDTSLRPAIRATIAISTDLLKEVATGVMFAAVILVIAAWFAGPGRFPRTAREGIAPFLRERPVATYAITVGLLALLFLWNPIPATGTPAGILTFTVLALIGTEVLRRQTFVEFPEARSGAARQAMSARWASMRNRPPRAQAAPAGAQPTTAEQLKQLAELRDSGELTPEEYGAAKAQLLHQ